VTRKENVSRAAIFRLHSLQASAVSGRDQAAAAGDAVSIDCDASANFAADTV